MHQRLGGKLPGGELALELCQLTPPLVGYEVGADNRSQENDGQRWPQPDLPANGNEEANLDRWDQYEQEEENRYRAHVGEHTGMGRLCHMELRDLPKVDELAARLSNHELPERLAVVVARSATEMARQLLLSGQPADPRAMAEDIAAQLAATRPTRIINATGVLLHTNLGRAPLSPPASAAVAEINTHYSNVEIDRGSGARGNRSSYANHLLIALTGAEAALVVNNNAAALLLALAALATGGGAVVSRGEEIEIGGSFRLPELMEASGARLVEVGTTNRTRLADYEAVASEAAVLLKVHPSNYRLEGFSESTSYAELAELGRRREVPLIADIGSGLLDTGVPWLPGSPPKWLREEPGVRQTLEDGADLVLFSGDKLLGGPQAGIAVGRADLVERMAKHPLARALRIDGATHAALATTLDLYASGRTLEIPFWSQVVLGYEDLEVRHHLLLERLDGNGDVVAGESLPGAGSVPGETIPSPNLLLSGRADQLWESLLAAHPPILARRREGRLLIDLRTVDPTDDTNIVAALS